MTKRSSIYWYNQEPAVKNAILYNCRDDDLDRDVTSRIEKGTIVVGRNGVAIAESVVPGLRARQTASFAGTRRCEWQGLELSCMVHPTIGQQTLTTKELRHRGYIVALLPDPASVEAATKIGIGVVKDAAGHDFVNLSVERHAGQDKRSRAVLL